MSRTFLLFLLVLVVVAAIVAMPMLTIWSLNTLFGTGIETTIKTWFAALLLASFFSGPAMFSKK
jgi:hypothetical protein